MNNNSTAGFGGYPRTFWIANSVELLERAAYYGVFIVITLYLSRILGFGLSGYLLDAYCPDPRKFANHEAWQAAASNAHYIWYIFATIALVSAISLIIYGKVVRHQDAKRAPARLYQADLVGELNQG